MRCLHQGSPIDRLRNPNTLYADSTTFANCCMPINSASFGENENRDARTKLITDDRTGGGGITADEVTAVEDITSAEVSPYMM